MMQKGLVSFTKDVNDINECSNTVMQDDKYTFAFTE